MSWGVVSWLLVAACVVAVVCQVEGVEVVVSADGSSSAPAASSCDEELAAARTQFVFSNPLDDNIPPHAVYDKLPANVKFAITDIFQLKQAIAVQANQIALQNNTNNVTTSRYPTWREVIESAPKGSICKDQTNPAVDTDTIFAAQRFNGIVSQIIHRLNSEILTKFPSLTSTVLRDSNINFQKELERGNLYYVWYDELENIASSPQTFLGANVPTVPRYLPLPLAIFRFQDQELHPVLIQLSHNHSWYTYYPASEKDRDHKNWSWLYAKLAVHAAEFNYHEPVKHSATTHFVIEPIIVATNRELCSSHPVFQLLSPHFDKTLSINDLIRQDTTVAAFSGVDNPTRQIIIERGFARYGFQDFQIINDLERRGFNVRTDSKGRHHLDDEFEFYSYATDQLALWDAIYQFVEDVIKSVYKSDNAVVSDLSLQNWAHVLASQIRIRQFPEIIRDIPTLINTLTHIIWTSTSLHASINYPQYWFFCGANYVGALYAPPPDPNNKSIGESYVLSALPPIGLVNLVTAVMDVGSTPPGKFQLPNHPVSWIDTLLYQYAQKGYHNVVPDSPAPNVPQYIRSAIPDFEHNLKKVSDQIKERDNDGHHTGLFSYRQYWWLNPEVGQFLADSIYL